MKFAGPGGGSRERRLPSAPRRPVADIKKKKSRNPRRARHAVSHGWILGVALAHFITGNSARWGDYVLAPTARSRALTVQGETGRSNAVTGRHAPDLTPRKPRSSRRSRFREAAHD